MVTTRSLSLPLVGAGGEPVSLQRTLVAHGVTGLPPARLDETSATIELAVRLPGTGVRPIRIEPGNPGEALVTGYDLDAGPEARSSLEQTARWLLRLDADLTPFYTEAARDPDLAWVTRGAGRMARCHTVFEDVIKTILTTNCAWSATVRTVTTLVNELGEPYTLADGSATVHAFPTPEAMAAKDEAFYREVIRCGYRAKSLRAIAEQVATGTVDLEVLGRVTPEEMPDDEVRARLIALPGIGPYAAAHVMMMLGRPSRLILDSWTRPTYARLTGAEASDAEIEARFARYGPYAGLAFWLFITRDWVADDAAPVEEER
jgi:N-glycosylase/DNA lyase